MKINFGLILNIKNCNLHNNDVETNILVYIYNY